jgi:N-terminal region of glycosyl transferase group 7
MKRKPGTNTLAYLPLSVISGEKKSFITSSPMNVGFVEASKVGDFDCVIFHDVDLLPEDDRSVVRC